MELVNELSSARERGALFNATTRYIVFKLPNIKQEIASIES